MHSILGNKFVLEFGESLRLNSADLWQDIEFGTDMSSEEPRLFVYISLKNNTTVTRNDSYTLFRHLYLQMDFPLIFDQRDWLFVMFLYEDQIVDSISFDEIMENTWWGEGNEIPHTLEQGIRTLCIAEFGETLTSLEVELIDQDTTLIDINLKEEDDELGKVIELMKAKLTALFLRDYYAPQSQSPEGEFDWILNVKVIGSEFKVLSNLD